MIGVPKSLEGFPWYDIDENDLHSVSEKEEVTCQAFFAIIYHMIRRHNSIENNTCVVHPFFFDEWKNDPHNHVSVNNFTFFENSQEVVVIPFLQDHHYFVVFANCRTKQILYCDSMSAKLVNEETLKAFLHAINNEFDMCEIEYESEKATIYRQKDNISCGILTLHNIESYIETQLFQKSCNVNELRMKYHCYLRNFISCKSSQQTSKSRKDINKSKSDEHNSLTKNDANADETNNLHEETEKAIITDSQLAAKHVGRKHNGMFKKLPKITMEESYQYNGMNEVEKNNVTLSEEEEIFSVSEKLGQIMETTQNRDVVKILKRGLESLNTLARRMREEKNQNEDSEVDASETNNNENNNKDPDYVPLKDERLENELSLAEMKKMVKKSDEKKCSLESLRKSYRIPEDNKAAKKFVNRCRKLVSKNTESHPKLLKKMKTRVNRVTNQLLNQKSELHDMNIKVIGAKQGQAVGLTKFKASDHWVKDFKNENHLKSRHIDKYTSQRAIDDSEKIKIDVKNFKTFTLPSLRKTFAPKKLYNCDQTGIQLEQTRNRTIARVGEKKVVCAVQRDHATTHSYTLHVVIRADGCVAQNLFVVLHEVTKPKSFHQMVSGFKDLYVTCSKSGKMTSDLAVEWMLKDFLKQVEPGSCLVLDSWTGFKRIFQLQEVAAKNLKIVQLPKKTTNELQPLDLALNRQLKNFMQKISAHVRLFEKNFILSNRKNILLLLQLTYNQLKSPVFKGMIQQGFYKMGYFEKKLPHFQTLVQYCFDQTKLNQSDCKEQNCHSDSFMRCAWCDETYCFAHTMNHLH